MRLKVWRPLWGEVLFGQPLYVPTVKVGPGLATKDVVYVATMSNNIYAFDVNDENSTRSYQWDPAPVQLQRDNSQRGK